MAGILGKSQRARDALTASPLRRALFRLPWLAVGSQGVPAPRLSWPASKRRRRQYHGGIFVPAIVYLADAVGTQIGSRGRTRALARENASPSTACGQKWGPALIGGGLAMALSGLVWASFGEIRLAATVALSVFGASTVATLVGSVLPSAFDWLDYDPALCAGPVGTVIQDVLSLLIYFSIASMLVFWDIRGRTVRFGPRLRGSAIPGLTVHVEICEDRWVPTSPRHLRGHGRRHCAGQPVEQRHHRQAGIRRLLCSAQSAKSRLISTAAPASLGA